MRAGREFDKARDAAYPYREIHIEGSGGKRYRLDSYNPRTGEIVSRKHTQLSAVQEETAMRYIREIPSKYPRNAVIADVPRMRKAGIAGEPLRGNYFLEVPVQRAPIPPRVLDYAELRKVTIRDISGYEY